MGSHVFVEFNEFFAYVGAAGLGAICALAPIAVLLLLKFASSEKGKRP